MREQELVSFREDGLYCTVVSIVPFEIVEAKPGLTPPVFIIPAAKNGEMEIIYVGKCFHYVYIGMDRGSLQIRDSPEEIARSIVYDYVSSQLGVYPGSTPGLFYLPGKLTKIDIIANYAKELAVARDSQKNWFEKLVELGDKYWTRYENRMAICDFMKIAAKEIGMNPAQHPWMSTVSSEILMECPVCFTRINPASVICKECKAVLDKEKYAKLTIAE